MSPPSGDDCTIGVDVGTTSVKAVAVDGEGRVVARTRVAHSVGTPTAELLEHDVSRAWRRGPRKAFADVSEALDGPAAGVVVTSMVPSVTAVDRRLSPLLPGLLYGDARAAEATGDPDGAGDGGVAGMDGLDADDLADLDRRQSAERYQGQRMLAWAVHERPGARGYWNCQATATHALAGVPAVDQATATSFGELYEGGRWDPEGLRALGVEERQLPVVGGMGEGLGTVPGSPTVFAGGSIDAFCEQIVAGANQPGDVLVIFGATLIVWVVAEEWRDVPGLTTLPNIMAGQVMIGGPSNAGALFADWARTMTGRSSRPKASDPAAEAGEPARPGDPERVPVWLPYLRGERTPFHDPTLRSSLHGLDIAQGPDSVLRAAHEASGFVVRRIIDRSGFGAKRIVATGGGSRSLPWMQAVADATGLPVDTVAVSEGAALGAAFLAQMAAGRETSFDAADGWARSGRRIDPDPRWTAAADGRFQHFLALGPPG